MAACIVGRNIQFAGLSQRGDPQGFRQPTAGHLDIDDIHGAAILRNGVKGFGGGQENRRNKFGIRVDFLSSSRAAGGRLSPTSQATLNRRVPWRGPTCAETRYY